MTAATVRGVAALLLLLATPYPGLLAQQRDFGHDAVTMPTPTEDGTWSGTWAYTNRDLRIVVWMRDRDGDVPEVKLNYFDNRNAESFETDWTGEVEYAHRTRPGRFALHLSEAEGVGIHGTWELRLGSGTSGRTEDGTFRLYRAGDGRLAVMQFERYKMVLLGSPPKVVETAHAWTFRKLSRRLIGLQELPL